MKRETIEEAINNISEEYRQEVLDVENASISDNANMGGKKPGKKIILLGIAATLGLGLGVTTYARGGFGMKSEVPETEVTYTVPVESEVMEVYYVTESVIDDEGNVTEIVDDTPSYITTESFDMEYENITYKFTFAGPDECKKISFKANYLPDNYDSIWAGGNTYGDEYLYVINDDIEASIMIDAHYVPEFGKDGCLFINEYEILNSEQYSEGDLDIVKVERKYNWEDGTSSPTEYLMVVCNREEGYIISIVTVEGFDECQKIYDGLEIISKKKTISYKENANHNVPLYIGCGVG